MNPESVQACDTHRQIRDKWHPFEYSRSYCAYQNDKVNLRPNYRPQRSWGKVMFLQASVILLTGGEGGTSPPPDYVPPQTTYLPGLCTPRTTYPPGLRTPLDYVPPRTMCPPDYVPPGLHTPRTMYPPDYIPHQTTYPLDYVPPLGLHTPPDYVPPLPWTVYVRAVRILLECILVFIVV